MVNFRRQYIQVNSDRRKSTRIEFHFPVVILGIDDAAQILDFSMDGFYIETKFDGEIVLGQNINLALRLPMERDSLRIKANVVYKDNKGIGVRFIDVTPLAYEKLERCFNVFNATLPID